METWVKRGKKGLKEGECTQTRLTKNSSLAIYTVTNKKESALILICDTAKCHNLLFKHHLTYETFVFSYTE